MIVFKLLALGVLLLSAFSQSHAATVVVEMRNNFFSPATVNINAGDTVTWVQRGSNHDTVSYDGLWASPILRLNQTFSHTFTSAGSFRYFCTPHEQAGMIGTVNVQGGNTAPTVSLTAPANGATFLTTDTITFSANASDDGSVAQVEFFAGANLIGTDASAPFTVTGSLPAGTHSITAKATDNAGATTTSSAVSITVNNPNQVPTVAITEPAPGSTTLAAPATVVLRASANDPDGSIAQVEFFNGSASVGTDASAPYELSLSNLPAGVHLFTAVATDNSGAAATSAAVTVRVAAQPRFTSINRSAGSTDLTITAEGTDGMDHILQATSDFTTWTTLATRSPANGVLTFSDSTAEPRKFYRLLVE